MYLNVIGKYSIDGFTEYIHRYTFSLVLFESLKYCKQYTCMDELFVGILKRGVTRDNLCDLNSAYKKHIAKIRLSSQILANENR